MAFPEQVPQALLSKPAKLTVSNPGTSLRSLPSCQKKAIVFVGVNP